MSMSMAVVLCCAVLYVFAVATPRQRVLPVIDLASKQEDSLGWQLREMNHLVLPRVKNAVLEAALAATQVRQEVPVLLWAHPVFV